MFIKIAVNCLAPYEDNALLELSAAASGLLRAIFANPRNAELIRARLAACPDKEALLEFIVEFFKDKLVPERRYFDLLAVLSINYKGLSCEELMRVVG